jgi:hypothetical protein
MDKIIAMRKRLDIQYLALGYGTDYVKMEKLITGGNIGKMLSQILTEDVANEMNALFANPVDAEEMAVRSVTKKSVYFNPSIQVGGKRSYDVEEMQDYWKTLIGFVVWDSAQLIVGQAPHERSALANLWFVPVLFLWDHWDIIHSWQGRMKRDTFLKFLRLYESKGVMIDIRHNIL